MAIHPKAQRTQNPSYLKRLTDKFDLDAVGTVHVVRYPIGGVTKTWVVDGQHRISALINLGFGEWVVDAMVHIDVKDDRRASELFLRLNSRLTISPYDKFINELQSGDSTAVGVNDIVRKFGLVMGKQSSDGSVACPASLKKAYRHDDGKALDRALGILTSAYGKKSSALEGKLIEGMSVVTATNNGNLEQDSLVKKLAKYPGGAPALIGDAKGRMQFHRGSLARSIASLVVDTYNVGRRAGRLDPA